MRLPLSAPATCDARHVRLRPPGQAAVNRAPETDSHPLVQATVHPALDKGVFGEAICGGIFVLGYTKTEGTAPEEGGEEDSTMPADRHETRFEEGLGLETRKKAKRPSLYRVVLLNDDYTPMEFVVAVLENI